MTIVLRELTTSGAKYGASYIRNGRVLLRSWWLRNGSTGRWVADLQGMGGPQVRRPRQYGYETGGVGEPIPFKLGGTAHLPLPGDAVRCRTEMLAEWVSRAAPLIMRPRVGAQQMSSIITRETGLLPITQDLALANQRAASRHGEL